ncbi:MAG: thioredoxin-dependent thiol peroxidase [Verrucomicrobiota bacterium]
MKEPKPLSDGDTAPTFAYQDAAGELLHTKDLSGRPYLVYFYPRDDTPGCTKEACAFRDLFAEYEKAGIQVVGVSCDDENSHSKFRKKYKIPFPLASDLDHSIVEAFGVWGLKKFMGKEYEGIHRMSFLIGPDGKIIKSYPKVKPEQHASQVLEDALATL